MTTKKTTVKSDHDSTASSGAPAAKTKGGALARRAARRAGAIAFAATLLGASTASAQPTKGGAAAERAYQILGQFWPANFNQQYLGGETIFRAGPDGGQVWHDANFVEMLLDYSIATGDQSYLPTVAAYQGYNPIAPFAFYGGPGNPGGTNSFNDDDLWWALAFIRAYDVVGDTTYLTGAEQVFNHVCNQWHTAWNTQTSSQQCMGVPQTNDGTNYINTITNELLFATAAKLALRDPNYGAACSSGVDPLGESNTFAGWAWAEYVWFETYYSPFLGQSALPDGLDANCSPNGTAWTYNQGPILGALADLATLDTQGNTGGAGTAPDTLWSQAFSVAEVAMSTFQFPGTNVVAELNDFPTDTCTGSSDCPEFKGILMRYLSRLGSTAPSSAPGFAAFAAQANTFITTSANRLSEHLYSYQGSTYQIPENWDVTPLGSPNDDGVYETSETAGMEGLIAAIAPPTPPVPPAPPNPSPSVYGISETSGYTGDIVTITGTGFGVHGVIVFNFGTVKSEPMYGCDSDTSCSVLVPPGAGTVEITATVGAYTSGVTGGYTAASFAYKSPVVTSVGPSIVTSLGGTLVTIGGLGLNESMTVTFANSYSSALAPASSVWCTSASSCTALTPPFSGPTDLTVVVDGVRSATSPADQVTFLYMPVVTSIASSAPVWWTGETVTGTITIDEPAPFGGTQVTLTAQDAAGPQPLVGIPATVSVPYGATTVSFPIAVGASVPSPTVDIRASTYGGAMTSQWWPVHSGEIALAQSTVFLRVGVSEDVSLLVRPGSAGGSLSVSSSSAALVVPSSPLTIAAGALSASVPISTGTGGSTSGVDMTFGYEGTTLTVPVNILPALKVIPPIKVPPIHCVGLCQ